MSDCVSCPTGDGPATVVTTQAQANALPAVVLGSLFIRNVTEFLVSVPSTEIRGSLYISHVTVLDGNAYSVTFPNLKRVGCDVVVGRDTQWADSDGKIDVKNAGSHFSVEFKSLKTIGRDVIIGNNTHVSILPTSNEGIFCTSGGKQSVTFSKLHRVCGNVVVGSRQVRALHGVVLTNNSVHEVTMLGGFTVGGNLVIGIYNGSSLANTRGQEIFSSQQILLIGCREVRGSLVCGKYGSGSYGNDVQSSGTLTITFPLLVNCTGNIVIGHSDPLSAAAVLDGNLLRSGSQMHVTFSLLECLSSSLVVGTDVGTSFAGNWIRENCTLDVAFPRLHKIEGNVTLGGDGSGVFSNTIDRSTLRVNLEKLKFAQGFLNVCDNVIISPIFIRFALTRLCSVGGHFRFRDNSITLNLGFLGWDATRPLRCIGGPLEVLSNVFLQNIDGLSSLECVSTNKSVTVTNNRGLLQFCGLHALATDPDVAFTISGNAVNPSKAAIADSGACPDADRLRPRSPCWALCCPRNVTVSCTDSIDPIFTGRPKSECQNSKLVVYVDTVVKDEEHNCGGCTIQRQWTDLRCCGTTCVQKITVRCRCVPQLMCPADISLPLGSSHEPSVTGSAECNCISTCSACSGANNCSHKNENVDCSIAHTDAILSRYSCKNNLPKHVQRTWTCTDACGRTTQCVQNIYFFVSENDKCQ